MPAKNRTALWTEEKTASAEVNRFVTDLEQLRTELSDAAPCGCDAHIQELAREFHEACDRLASAESRWYRIVSALAEHEAVARRALEFSDHRVA